MSLKLYLILLSSCIFTLSARSTYYINQNALGDISNGTRDYPFPGLNEAIKSLGIGNYELVLLGDEITINSNLDIAAGSSYTIKPEHIPSGKSHFLMKIGRGVQITATGSNLTFEDIQILDLDLERDNMSVVFYIKLGHLTFKRVLVTDIHYHNNAYVFLVVEQATENYDESFEDEINSLELFENNENLNAHEERILTTQADSSSTEISIIDSEFSNLLNFGISFVACKTTIINTKFNNLVQRSTPFITVYTNMAQEVILKNVTVENAVFDYIDELIVTGFINMIYSTMDVLLENVKFKNITITNSCMLINLVNEGENPSSPTSFNAVNITLEDMIEMEDLITPSSQIIGSGIFMDVVGATYFTLDNFTATNVKLQNASLIRFQPTEGYFLIDRATFPSAKVRNVKIQSSTNANLLLFTCEDVNIDNYELLDNLLNSTTFGFPMLYISTVTNLVIKNFKAENHYGPIFRIEHVLNHEFTDCIFKDVYTSQKFDKIYQNFLQLSRLEKDKTIGLVSKNPPTSIFRNFNVYGYTDAFGINSSSTSNDTYFMILESEIGEVHIIDSIWSDVEMGSLLSVQMNYLKIDNLTVDYNPFTPTEEIAWHRVLQFVNIGELQILNSKFVNNRNVVIMSLFNIDRSNLFDKIFLTKMIIDNVTVLNNTGDYLNPDAHSTCLFNINSPLKPVNISFSNSYFDNNKILSGIILHEESLIVNMNLTNNTFTNNFASQTGSVFTAQSMQSELSGVEIVNNTFKNNTSLGKGGVFAFFSTRHAINALNNTYIENSATTAGGVGYTNKGKIFFVETNSTYSDNFASGNGGSWYFSLSRMKKAAGPATFIGTTFSNSTSTQQGGAIYITTGDLILKGCSLKANKALVRGGDIYIVTMSSVYISDSSFTASDAPEGSLLYTETISDETIILKDSIVANILPTKNTSTVIHLNSGLFIASNVSFSEITSSIFKVEGTSMTLDRLSMREIRCLSTLSFCILQGAFIDLNFTNSQLSNIISTQDLISLSSPSGVIRIDKVEMSNVVTKNGKSTDRSRLFGFKLTSADNIVIKDSVFNYMPGFLPVSIEKSSFKIENSRWSNTVSQRLLQQADIPTESNFQNSQFLVLDSSSGSIEDSWFTANTYTVNSNINGGAIQIKGSGGDYRIDKCIFNGNKAYRGGAISIEGIIERLEIESSSFLNNTAALDGGAIYMMNESIRELPIIKSSTFSGNYAYRGGAFFIGNQQIIFEGSTIFESNTAQESGGAIASFAEGKKLVFLGNTAFTKNIAKVGSALRAFGKMNFDLQDSTFSYNVAKYGGAITTKPLELRVTIYEVDEAFMFMDNPPVDYILSHPKTKIVFDSKNATSVLPLAQKTGRAPNYLFEFTFLDEFGKGLPTLEQAEIRIRIEGFEESTDHTVTPGLLGKPVYNFTGANGYVFGSFYIRGETGTKLTLATTASFNNTFSNKIQTLPSVRWPVVLAPCSIGEIYDSENLICSPCPAGTYSYLDPYVAESCYECAGDITCRGGKIIYPIKGFWRMDEFSDNIIECFNNEACLGGERDGGNDISLTGFCDPRYEGLACSNCIKGYAKFGTSQKCLDCQKQANYYIRFIAYLLIQVGIITFTTRAYLMNTADNEQDKKSDVIKSTLLKIIIDFVQILNLTSEFRFRWPDVVGDFLTSVTKITPTNKDAFSVDCFIALIRGTNEDIFFIKVLLLMLQPILFVVIGVIIWTIIFRVSKKPILNNSELRERILVTSIVIIYILQPGIVKSTFQLFNCKNFGPIDDKEYYLAEDTHIKCWESKHVAWALGLGVPSLIIWFVIPSAILVFLAKKKEITQSESFVKKFTFVAGRYRNNSLYWEVVILARKIILIIFAVFLAVEYLQAYLSFIVLILAYALQYRLEPFCDISLNRAEKLSLFSSAFIIYTGLFFVRLDRIESLVPLLLALDTLTGVVFFLYCLYLAKAFIHQQLTRFRKKMLQLRVNMSVKPGILGKISRKTFITPPSTSSLKMIPQLSQVHLITTPITTETELKDPHYRIELPHEGDNELYMRMNSRVPSIAEFMEKDLKPGRVHYQRSSSIEYNEESTNGLDSHNRIRSSLRSNDDMLRLFSARGTETDLLNSFRGERSVFRRNTLRHEDRHFPILASQVLDGDEDKLYKIGSMPDLGLHRDLQLDVVVEEAPTATLKKSMLKDDRFKDVDNVHIIEDEQEPQERRSQIDIESLNYNDIPTEAEDEHQTIEIKPEAESRSEEYPQLIIQKENEPLTQQKSYVHGDNNSTLYKIKGSPSKNDISQMEEILSLSAVLRNEDEIPIDSDDSKG